jgi:hypothetical protein
VRSFAAVDPQFPEAAGNDSRSYLSLVDTPGASSVTKLLLPALGTTILAAFMAASPAGATHAVDSPAVEQGDAVVTFNGHRTEDSAGDRDAEGEWAFEFGYAPTSYWKTTVGWIWLEEPGGSPQSDAIAWENVFELTEPGRHWADLGVLVKYGRLLDGGDDAAEIALLVEKAIGPSTLLLNLLAGRELADGVDTAYGYSLSWAMPVRAGLDVGVEWYGEFGDGSDFGRLPDRLQQAGPVVYGEISDPGGGAFVFEAAVLFGLTAEAPDATFRLLLEYAF